MSRRLAVTIGLIVFVGAPRSAKADEIWALAQLGVGYGAGSYSFEGTADPGFGMDGQTLRFETPIRGFAVVLLIGIITSVFTAVNFTRMLVALWVRRARPKSLNI